MSQTQNQNIGPSSLQPNYLLAIDKIIQLQTSATLLQTQVVLDLPDDEGLAMEVRNFQKQMNAKAEYIHDQLIADFIGLLSESSNFYYLWNAAVENEPDLIKSAVNNTIARTSSSQVMLALANQSGLLNQKAKRVVANLAVIQSELDETNENFDHVLQTIIDTLTESESKYTTSIDVLQKAIKKNIDEIVEGANKTGAATSELLIGILTTIKDASPGNLKEKSKDTSKAGSKDKPNGNPKDKSKGDSKDKNKVVSKDKSKDYSKDLSTDFVVNSIKGAKEGAEETSQARADLNINNEKLATAFQDLAKANALIAVAKVVKMQNDIFTKGVRDSLSSIHKISETWGNTPILPPASGISLSLSTFSESINSTSSQEDADRLIAIMDYVSNDWDAFNNQLIYFKRKLINIS